MWEERWNAELVMLNSDLRRYMNTLIDRISNYYNATIFTVVDGSMDTHTDLADLKQSFEDVLLALQQDYLDPTVVGL